MLRLRENCDLLNFFPYKLLVAIVHVLLIAYFVYCLAFDKWRHCEAQNPAGEEQVPNLRSCFLEDQMPLFALKFTYLLWPLEVCFEWFPVWCSFCLKMELSVYFLSHFVFWLGNIIACFILRKEKYIFFRTFFPKVLYSIFFFSSCYESFAVLNMWKATVVCCSH